MRKYSSIVVVALLAICVASASAETITIKSDATTLAAPFGTSTFSPVVVGTFGTFTPIPPGAPAGTVVVQIPPTCGWWCGQSGYFLSEFTLPSGFTNAALNGIGNVDDYGYVFLNGHNLGVTLTEFGNVAFSAIDPAFFVAGVNQLLISDYNSGGGPSGAAFYATITYGQQAPVPEPASLVLLGTGLIGLARRVAKTR